jgi:NAD kinase
MREIKIDNHLVIYDDYNIEQKPELQNFLKSKKLEKILSWFKDEVIVVLWWDGTILRAIRSYYKDKKSFLPINFGSKWFLLNDKDFIKKKSEFVKREYPLLDLKVKTNWESFKDIAFNEVVLKDIDWKMLDLDISVGKSNFLNLKGDWLLVSTPAWSTWYNSSLYWPILPHSSNSFVMTYMAAWQPKHQAPAIIENTSKINVKNTWRIHWTSILADWNKILTTSKNQDFKLIIKKSKHKVKFLIEKSYVNNWDNKVLEEQGFSS